MARAVGEHLLARASSLAAIRDSFPKLDPRLQFKNPVMFIVELGSVITTGDLLPRPRARRHGQPLVRRRDRVLALADRAVRELRRGDRRGPRQGAGERAARDAHDDDRAPPRCATARSRRCPAPELQRGDVVVVEAGEVIPADGEIIEGVGSVDESAITGESAPVIREAGGDRSAVTGGTKLLSDRLVIQVTQEPGKSFLDRMIALVEGAERRKTPNEIALNILLAGLTITFLAAVVTLQPYAIYAGTPLVADRPDRAARRADPDHDRRAALGDRHRRHGPARAAQRARDVGPRGRGLRRRRRAAARQDRHDHARQPPGVRVHPGRRRRRRASSPRSAQLASLADETPEGRSIVVLAKEQYGLRGRELGEHEATFIPFSATTRMSGVDLNGNQLPQGRGRRGQALGRGAGRHACRPRLDEEVDRIARAGGTPLVVAQDNFVLGVIHLKDIVKGGMRERFDELRRMGIRTVMITGDNRVTAAVIAEEAGVDDFLAEATPEAKMALIKEEQAKGRMVAMTGDGTNDAPGARAGRRRRGDEHRHLGRQGGRQHGRPRLEPDEADRDRRGRQAAADHPRRADHVLDRERRRQVLRDPAGDVRVHLRDEAGRARAARTRSTSCTSARPRARSSRRSSSTR